MLNQEQFVCHSRLSINNSEIIDPEEQSNIENDVPSDVSAIQMEVWRDLLRQIPVAVNNFYGDPVIQWPDTIKKLESLEKASHKGPVGLILKGKLSAKKVQQLKELQEKGLEIVVLVSISELPDMEGVGSAHRYENIRLLGEAGIPSIAYIRPIMPPYNTSEEVLKKIFTNLGDVGCQSAVVSGFRGDEDLVNRLSPDDRVEWAMRVKVMPYDVYQMVKRLAEENGVQLFTRTACAVSAAIGADKTYNPYFNSRNLVKCEELNCPIRETCIPPLTPKEGSLELLEHLGFNVEFIPGNDEKSCSISGEDRLKCPSCCTTCYLSKNIPHLLVRGNVNLGDLAFIRFVSGLMAMQPGQNDDGSKDIGKIHFPNYSQIDNVQALNSWWPVSRNISKCFDCKYCIVSEYYNEAKQDEEVGFPPSELIDRISNK